MPKQRINKEMILDVAFRLAREKGYEIGRASCRERV